MRSARVPLAYIQRNNATQAQVCTAGSFAPPVFAASAMVGVMFTCLRRQGGLGLPADVTSQVELFAMGPTPSAMAVQKELSALPSGLISAAERQVARGGFVSTCPSRPAILAMGAHRSPVDSCSLEASSSRTLVQFGEF